MKPKQNRTDILREIIQQNNPLETGLTPESSEIFQELCNCYKKASKSNEVDSRLCIYTGAGVSAIKEGVYCTPAWQKLLESVYEQILLDTPDKIDRSFEELYAERKSPWDVASYFEEKTDLNKLQKLIREGVQRWVGKDFGKEGSRDYKRLPRSYLAKQTTLNATIAFCSAISRINLYPCYKPNLDKIQAILTLNYDWFLEGGATTKYESAPFKPMARISSKFLDKKMPVYHIHGYFPYRKDEDINNELGKNKDRTCELILTRQQYEDAYHQEESFLSKHLNYFYAQQPSLFVGISFDDDYFLARLRMLADRTPNIDRFTLFKQNNLTEEKIEKIESAGIKPIFFKDYLNVQALLGEVYKKGLDKATCSRFLQEMGVPSSGDCLSDYWKLLLYNKK